MTPTQWLLEAWPDAEILPFSRFMELCLYHPQLGYYERDTDQIGPQGDFLTSVSSSVLFGQLLAFQFARWLEQIPTNAPCLVEAGAHDGTLACDILRSFAHQKAHQNLQYWIVEPSLRRRERQQARLEDFAGQVRWTSNLEQLPPLAGIVFSNELLDAFPTRRLGWDAAAQCWFEWGVARLPGPTLSWSRLPLAPADASALLRGAGLEWSAELGRVLPEEYTLDLCPAAGEWWQRAARTIQAGWLMTVDYGFLAEELLVPHRVNGTLRAYQAHHQFANVLEAPGQRDLTAHVNFTDLMRKGEAAGLRTEGLFTQERFLMGIARQMHQARPDALEGQAQRLQALVHPDRQPFRVLVQRRGQVSSA